MRGVANRWERKLSRQEAIAEVRNRFLQKDRSLERAAFEEVFDTQTLMTIYKLMTSGLIEDFYGVVNAGKESRIYHARSRAGEELAVKIYLVNNREFRRRTEYLAMDSRIGRVGGSVRRIIYAWARREFLNLQQAHESGVRCPKPFVVRSNVLVMGFLGKDGVRYPLLRELDLGTEELESVYEEVLRNLRALYQKAGLVHGDLSEYNVMLASPEEVYFIDLSQSVLRDHPLAGRLLMRDIRNVNRYFSGRGAKVIEDEELYAELTSHTCA
ncbi:MAG: serine protein kinase RIO [Thaumarchaeota archaeon]|nr:serine protein kinase RIO [Candidatus Calditenuaceae archaeon]